MKGTKRLIFMLAIIAGLLVSARAYQLLKGDKSTPEPVGDDQPGQGEDSSSRERFSPGSKFSTISIRDRQLQVELAKTLVEITQGLSGRDSLDTEGLLFVFGSPSQRTFWMKEMRFSIDLLWIADGKVIGIEENLPVPAPDTPDSQLVTYSSPGSASHVLELPAGRVEGLGIQIGDQVVTRDPNL